MSSFEKFTRFFCACAPGILIGLLLARRFGFFWPIGAVVGAMISYLLVEWKAVLTAIPQAFRRVTSWRPNKELWEARGIIVLAFFSASLSLACLVFGSMWSYIHFKNDWLFDVLIISTMSLILPISNMMSSFFVLSRGIEVENTINFSRDLIRFANPLAVFFYWPARGLWNTPQGIRWFCRNVVWNFLLFSGRLSLEMILIIHSRRRTLCTATTFITVVIGYVVNGDLAVFTIAGAAIGGLYSVSSLRTWVVAQLQPKLVI